MRREKEWEAIAQSPHERLFGPIVEGAASPTLPGTEAVLASLFVTSQVLVVEDDPDVRDSIVDLLQSEVPWIEVSSATDGMEALELLEEGAEPCLALLDLMMPVMNGVEFLDTVRDRSLAPAMQIVLISAHVQFARHVKYPGISGLLPKPFQATDLLEIVRRHCPDPAASSAQS